MSVGARGTEAALAATIGVRFEDVDGHEGGLGGADEDELRDPHAGLDVKSLSGVEVDQGDPYFAAVARVDQAGGVDE